LTWIDIFPAHRSNGIRLFKVLGIRISIDRTWFIVFVLIAWSLSFGYFPLHLPGLGKLTYVIMGVVSSLILFMCVLAHELSHSYVSNRLGLPVRGITLFIFGGVAELSKEPEDPKTELKIAVAGPMASAGLALIFYAASIATASFNAPTLTAVTSYLAMINIMLVIFNMIPGFPLDGGRVLRALWWMRTKDLTGATRAASMVGKGFAVFLILSGLLQITRGGFIGGIWSIFIGLFLRQAAQSSYQQVLMKTSLDGVKVSEIMSKNVITITADLSVASVVENYFLSYHFASFPVIKGGDVKGILTLKGVKELQRDDWDKTGVQSIMEELTSDDVLEPDDSALTASTAVIL
jgi:Zn-dependent protease